jgi:hypothetical protein
MSESLDPKRNELVNDSFDQIFEFDVEMIPDQEGIDAVLAWSKAKAKANDPKPADAETERRDDPDRPAA